MTATLKDQNFWDSRERKELARARLFEDAGPASCYLTLPGVDCRDVEDGHRLGVLGSKSTVIAVERKPEIFKQIIVWFQTHKKWFAKPILAKCALDQLKIKRSVDLAYLDYLGNLNRPDMAWIRESLVPHLAEGARVGITVSKAYRGNTFVPVCHDLLFKKYSDYCRKLANEIRNVGNHYPVELISPCLVLYSILFQLLLFPVSDYYYQIGMDYYGEPKSPFVMVLFRILNFKHQQRRPLTEEEEDIRGDLEQLCRISAPFRMKRARKKKNNNAIKNNAVKSSVKSTSQTLNVREVVDLFFQQKGDLKIWFPMLKKIVRQEVAKGRVENRVVAGIKRSITCRGGNSSLVH
jgi:hypothetical protein